MRPRLLTGPAPGPFTFVVGKGGAGKSTTAAALALNWADQGAKVHLISTDPAPSIHDIFGPRETCSDRLTVEELNAQLITTSWMENVRASLEEVIEKGTYLDRDDVARLSHLTLPGVDELGAALRLAELAKTGAHVVVDTAPTGHTLRLLDTADLIDSWTRVFSTMANKVATISMMMVNARVRLQGEDTIASLQNIASSFRDALRDSSFVVVTRSGEVVEAETMRLIKALRARDLTVVAVVEVEERIVCDVGVPVIHIPRLDKARGCDGLRAWRDAAAMSSSRASSPPASSPPTRTGTSASVSEGSTKGATEVVEWIRARPQSLLWFAGKGGTGKSTCASAVALCISERRHVLLCSTDPAGSLREVLQLPDRPAGSEVAPRLRVLQVDASAQLDEWRARYRAEAESEFEELGVGGSATLDRDVMNAIWDAVPPGIDELFALSEILDVAEGDETIVVDAAPTGHFLRLIESPGIALDWTHAILRILLKYGVAGKLEGFSERVLALARQLKQLRAMLIDADKCGVFVVSLDEQVVAAQTERLVAALGASDIAVLARVINRVPDGGHVPITLRNTPGRVLFAPLTETPPQGVTGLTNFLAGWQTA
jgi:arsenite-transporting ATPase